MAKSGYERLNKTLLFVEGPLWTFIKKFWQIGLIITLACVCFILYQQNKKSKGDVQFLRLHLDTAFQQMKEWKDVTGKLHEVAQEAMVQRNVMRQYSDSIAKLLKVKPKQIEATSQTVTKIVVKEKLKVDTQFVDSSKKEIKSFHFQWSDTWINVDGHIGNDDSIYIAGTDTLNRVDYWKRKKILFLPIGRKEHFVDFNNSNPHIKTTGYKGLSIDQKPKHWSIGPSVQWFYPMKVTAGISLQYSIIRF